MRTFRGRRLDGDVEDEIRDKALTTDWNAAQVQRYLKDKYQGAERNKVPDIRTIRKRLDWWDLKNTSGPWTLAEADDEEAALVLPVLAAVLDKSHGQIASLSRGEARWVATVRRIAPDLKPWDVYYTARLCAWVTERDEQEHLASLEALLAFAPWRSRKAMERFVDWASRYRKDWFQWLPVTHPIVIAAGVAKVRRLNVAGLWVAQEIDPVPWQTLKH